MKIASPRRRSIFTRTCDPARPVCMADTTAPTHTAFVKKYLTKKQYVWLEIGAGRLDKNGVFHGLLDRTPIGGFNGYVHFAPIGQKPPEAEPERPDERESEEEF